MSFAPIQIIKARILAPLFKLMRNDNVALIAFVIALCVFSFGYGIIVMKLKTPPYKFIKHATESFSAVLALENQDLMTGVLEIGDDIPSAPAIRTLSDKAGHEDLLIIGGFYQFMSRCPTWGCIAWIIDRDGNVLHSWETDLDKLVADAPHFAGKSLRQNIYPIGAALAPDGSLYLSFHGRNVYPYQVGIAKFDVNGKLLWRHFDHSHHWIALDEQGRVYAPAMAIRKNVKYFGKSAVGVRCEKEIYDEGVKIYSPEGEVLKQFSMLDLFSQNRYPGFFYSLRDDCDPAHVNSVAIASPEVAAKLKSVAPGDMLVSVRESNVIAVIDPNTGTIKHLEAGRTAAQHSPKFLPDGSIVAFDNLGGRRALGGTRIARINIETNAVETVFPKDGETRLVPFFSGDGGDINVSPDGKRILVSVKNEGRIIEIDVASGAPVWVMDKFLDISPYLRERHLSNSNKSARFIAYGAYYVPNPRFLEPVTQIEGSRAH